MKILYVVGGLPFGGIENLLFDIARELSKRNIDYRIINISGTGEKTEEFFRANLPVVNLGNSKKILKTYRLPTAIKLRYFIKQYKPDIIHSMQFSADYFSRIATISIKDIKIITHIHTIKKEKRIERRIFNKLLSFKTDVFLSVSKDVFKVVEKEHNLARKQHYILYNAINTKAFDTETSLNLQKGIKYIACVGRLVKQKNFDVAIKAFSLIEKNHPDTRLLIVGDGGMNKKLQQLTKDLNIYDKVIFAGYRKDVPGILKKSYMLLMPSEYEGFGIAHLEAMYAGLPAIISPFVPSKEIASECSIIAPIDPQQIAYYIEKLLTDEVLYKELSLKAKEIAKNFTIEEYVNKLLTLYSSLILNKPIENLIL